jgi:hypothetical protein
MILLPVIAYLLVGEGVYHLLGDPVEDRSLYYRISLRLLLGMAGTALIFVVQDLVGIGITRTSVIASSLLVGIASVVVRVLQRNLEALKIGSWRLSSWSDISLPCILFSIPLVVLLAASFVQMTFLVPRAYDALVGWDLVGKVLSHEGAIRSSVFTHIRYNAQAVYPPFCSTMQGLFYIFTPATPRMWVPIMLLPFMVIFGEEVWRITRRSALAALSLLIIFTVRELNFHLTVAQTDLPNMIFVTLGFLWALRYPDDRRSVGLASLFMLLATMTRSETILVALGVCIWMLARSRFKRWDSLWVLIPSVAFFAFWNLIYVRGLIGYDPADHFRTTLDLDLSRAFEVLRLAFLLVIQRDIYGELGLLALVGLALWVGWILLGRRLAAGLPPGEALTISPGHMLGLLALGLLFYLSFFYQWDPVLNPLWTMEHTFKRGFFRYIPLLVLFVLSTARLWEALVPAIVGAKGRH